MQTRSKAIPIDIRTYLNRIGVNQKAPSLKYLKELQKAHLLTIPFENLDIHYKNKIILDYQKVFNKIVTSGRGGFCYELNGLFYHLLYHLGFNCYVISGRVWSDEKKEFGKPFDHMLIVVDFEDDKYLVDVGFGDGLISPLKIEVAKPQMDYTKYWRLDHDPDENFILKVSHDNSYFEPKLLFTLDSKQLIQFMEMCDYHQTSAESAFTQKKLVTQLTFNGRVTLTDRCLKIQDMGQIAEKDIMHEDDFLSKLKHHFDISFQQLLPRNE